MLGIYRTGNIRLPKWRMGLLSPLGPLHTTQLTLRQYCALLDRLLHEIIPIAIFGIPIGLLLPRGIS